MRYQKSKTFHLENFAGPLEFLLYLIQKEEILSYEISLEKIMAQFKEQTHFYQEMDLDQGAEFLGQAAFILWHKSKMLLPSNEIPKEEKEVGDPDFAVIHHLLDYYRFKEVAKNLSKMEIRQLSCHPRGQELAINRKKPLGIEHLSIEDLTTLFHQVLDKAPMTSQSIVEEKWQVADKIAWIKELCKNKMPLKWDQLFPSLLSRAELIVTFLAVLELIKQGDLKITKELMPND